METFLPPPDTPKVTLSSPQTEGGDLEENSILELVCRVQANPPAGGEVVFTRNVSPRGPDFGVFKLSIY